MRQVEQDIFCLVRFVDMELHSILPGDIMEFSLEDGLTQPAELTDERAQNLVIATTTALSQHLEVHGKV